MGDLYEKNIFFGQAKLQYGKNTEGQTTEGQITVGQKTEGQITDRHFYSMIMITRHAKPRVPD